MSFATDAPRPSSQIFSIVEQKKPQQNSYNHRIDLEEQTVWIVVVVVPIWDGRASSCLLYFIAAIRNCLTCLTNLSSSLSRPVIFVLLSSAGYTYSRVPCSVPYDPQDPFTGGLTWLYKELPQTDIDLKSWWDGQGRQNQWAVDVKATYAYHL